MLGHFNNGEEVGLQNERQGGGQDLPLQKGLGAREVLAILRGGGTKSLGVV